MSKRPTVAVVIPTLNEATTIIDCIRTTQSQGVDELVVADAHSPDGTAELVRSAGVTLLPTPRGRGVQQNRGAAVTRSEILLFLHADCRLGPGAVSTLRAFMQRAPRVPGGCFRMKVEAPDLPFRSIDAAAHLRAGVFGLPYGDQGIFVRRTAFEQLGGFHEYPIMEDLDFSRRLSRLGRIALLPTPIVVSPRRWRRRGIAVQTITNWGLTLAAAAGVDFDFLARYYPPLR